MDLVGRAVRKEFPSFGTFAGVVESFDPEAGYFKVLYEDGDSEEVDAGEAASMLVAAGEERPPAAVVRRSTRGRRPKKRRCGEAEGSGGDGIGDEDLEGEFGGAVENRVRGDGSSGGVSERLVERNELISIDLNREVLAGCVEENASLDSCKDVRMEEMVRHCGYPDAGVLPGQGVDSDMQMQNNGQALTKRRRVSGQLSCNPETPLRRSARRVSTAISFSEDGAVSQAEKRSLHRDGQTLPADCHTQSCGNSCGFGPEEPKPELPPSSTSLDLEGLPVLDVFAVYACLRSFSRQLFLSPFRLETFVAALSCTFANSLIDSIHFSLLQTLKQHLEVLSEEGSQSAICCIRNFNWEFLDLVTWPVYLAEYLLVHSSEMRYDSKLKRLKLLNGEYYKQSAVTKLELLRILCDDVIEVESLRSEINSRMTEYEVAVETSRKVSVRRKRSSSLGKNAGYFSHHEMACKDVDGNNDECYLCGMDGNLICCDGCPAAFHSRCVGVAQDLLPEGDWYCPECSIEKNDELIEISKPCRGAEVLGMDPYGYLYLSSCGYLLVLDSSDTVASCRYYSRNDMDSVISVLQSCHPSYSFIISVISSCWSISIEPSPVEGQFLGNEHDSLYANPDCKNLTPLIQDASSCQVVVKMLKDSFASPEQLQSRNLIADSFLLNEGVSHEPVEVPLACSGIIDEIVPPATSVGVSQQMASDSVVENNITSGDVTSLKFVDIAAEKGKPAENSNGHDSLYAYPGHMNLLSLTQDASSCQVVVEIPKDSFASPEQLQSRILISDSSQLNEVASHEPVEATTPLACSGIMGEIAPPTTSVGVSQQVASNSVDKNNITSGDLTSLKPADVAPENGKPTENGNEHDSLYAYPDHKKLLPLTQDASSCQVVVEIPKDSFTSPEQLQSRNLISDSSQLNEVASHEPVEATTPLAWSGIMGEIAPPATFFGVSQRMASDSVNGNNFTSRDVTSLKLSDLASQKGKSDPLYRWGCTSSISEQRRGGDTQLHSDPVGYQNCYSFGRTASSIAEEILHSLSENMELKKLTEDIISLQWKAVSKKCASFGLYTYHKLSVDLQKEKCGWCHLCKTSDYSDCVFKVTGNKNLESSKARVVSLRSEKHKRSHIVSAMHHILSIEEGVRSLLSGPWQNPQYSNHWRKEILKASDVASLRKLLITLESNLRRVALSTEWQKPVDSSHVVGSAAHFVMGAAQASLNYGGGRKQGRRSMHGSEFNINSLDTGVYWWRGGKLSRQVFHWKVLPYSLVSKGGRQAGCKKIPTIFYPDGSEIARRTKCIAWRAAVEESECVAQLIFLIKEFDANIKWMEILGSLPLTPMTHQSNKSAKLFRKVIIRRKCMEGTDVKYLLDFGKRSNIPPIVARHGILLEESSTDRKRYWLGEGFVPLNILKAFEEKKLSQLLKKKDNAIVSDKSSDLNATKIKQLKGFLYLVSRAKKSESKLCGHCNRDVLISEAVNCQYCKGFFHRKHFRVCKGTTADTYICIKCKDKKVVVVKPKGCKVTTKKTSKRKRSQVIEKKKKRVGVKVGKAVRKKSGKKESKKAKPTKSKRKQIKCQPSNSGYKSRKCQSISQENGLRLPKRKRTVLPHSYWLNGLHWAQKPDDEQGKCFRNKNLFFPSQSMESSTLEPVCCLCKKEFDSEAVYISCEKCEDWFHGDVYCVNVENINKLIGFKCHKCRMRSTPVCPFSENTNVNEAISNREHGVGGGLVYMKGHKRKQNLHGKPYDCTTTMDCEDSLDEQGKDGVNTGCKEVPLVPSETMDCEDSLDEQEKGCVNTGCKEVLMVPSETGITNGSTTVQSPEHTEDKNYPCQQ